jgi:inosose dehydratase
VPGDGDYDFRPIMGLIKKNNYNGWIIVEAEQDPIKYDPFNYSLKGFDYIRQLLKLQKQRDKLKK